MDSNQEAANLAQIENVRLSRTMLKLMWASLAVSAICAIFAAWPLLRPSTASQAAPPAAGGDSMLSWMWIPAIVLGASSLVLTATLLIVAFKQWRYKKLARTTAQLHSDLNTAQSELELERGKPKFITDVGAVEDKLRTSQDEVQRLNIALSLARIREDNLEQELSSAKQLKETADGVERDRNNYRRWFNELAWLNPAIKEQQRDISNHVKVLAARPCTLNLKKRVVIIDLVIRNDSLFDIAIKGDAVSGRLLTEKNGLLHDPAKAFVDLIHHSIENLKPTKEATVAIIQPLLKTEAEDIEDAIADGGGYFWLGNLNIPISVENAEPLQVDNKPLRINSDVENIYFREFGALTFDGEAITPRELLRDVEALPFPERARIYREISKAYGESLWRLNEAEEKKNPEDLAQESINRNTNNA